MIIFGIETSCDETALSIIEASDKAGDREIRVLGNVLISQTKIHEQYGGVFPMVAKREHAKNLTPLLHKVLLEAGLYKESAKAADGGSNFNEEKLKNALAREDGLYEHLIKLLETCEKPAIDLIAVTSGPGLEPALWVGISFAKALSIAWDIPTLAVNHMEGHIVGALLDKSAAGKKQTLLTPTYPALALLISGGHTELVLIKKWGEYKVIGKTLDDAVGEAFDKAARLLGLPYPGGPEIGKLAAADREKNPTAISETIPRFRLPRPMLHSDTLDFSFSGIKTAVRYMVAGGQPHQKEPIEKYKTQEDLTADEKGHIAREFEDAVTEVLVAKTRQAIELHNVQTLILGGGVTANTYIRTAFEKLATETALPLLLPDQHLTTDNALMIALAGYLNAATVSNISKEDMKDMKAEGNLSL